MEFGIVQSRLTEIRQSGEVFGISVDSPFSLAKWAELEKFPDVPLLSDMGKDVTTAYDVLNPEAAGNKGFARRSAFLLDKQGKIAKMELVTTPGQLPDLEGFFAEIKNLA